QQEVMFGAVDAGGGGGRGGVRVGVVVAILRGRTRTRGGGEVFAQGVERQAQEAGGLGEELGADDFGAGVPEDVVEGLGGAVFLFGGGFGGVGQEAGAGELHGGAGVGAEAVVGGEAVFAEEEVGVDLGVTGAAEETDLEAGLQREGEEAQGGFLAGTVAVEEAFDLAVVAAQELQLAFGDGGALGGDGGLEADGPAAEGVELAFDEDKGMAFGGVLAGVVEVKEEVALAEDGGLGGVDVFGLAGGVVLGGE